MQLEAMTGKPDAYVMLDWQAHASAFHGRWQQSHDFSQRAVRMVVASGAKGLGFRFRARTAFRSAVVGRCAEARSENVPSDEVEADREGLDCLGAAFGLCGDSGRTEAVIAASSMRFPKYTLVNAVALPEAHAALAVQRGGAPAGCEAGIPEASDTLTHVCFRPRV